MPGHETSWRDFKSISKAIIHLDSDHQRNAPKVPDTVMARKNKDWTKYYTRETPMHDALVNSLTPRFRGDAIDVSLAEEDERMLAKKEARAERKRARARLLGRGHETAEAEPVRGKGGRLTEAVRPAKVYIKGQMVEVERVPGRREVKKTKETRKGKKVLEEEWYDVEGED